MNVARIARASVLIFAAWAAPVVAQGLAPAPSASELAGLTPQAVLSLANQWGMKADENKLTAWITSQAFNFTFADGSATVISMPKDRMLVSLAPYIMKTHGCSVHYPTSCRGELANTPVRVVAVTEDGRKLLDEKITTLPNGFIDLWLPRESKIDVTMEARGMTVTERVGTFDSDKTCVTTPKLHN